jgi:hypothetical protein
VGAFTMAGTYDINSSEFIMKKKYIGMHTVLYKGSISFLVTNCKIEGKWFIEHMNSEFFSINLSLKQPFITTPKLPSDYVDLEDFTKRKRQAYKVMLSHSEDKVELAEKLINELCNKGIPVVQSPTTHLNDMIKYAASEANVVVPLMCQNYENSDTLKVFLNYVDKAGIAIVPIKTEDKYMPKQW